ncbi:MAG: hypothetical protein ACI9FG_001220 [Crocinitomicaceae bacterium]
MAYGTALETQQFVNSALFLKFTWHIPVVKAVQLYRMRFLYLDSQQARLSAGYAIYPPSAGW